MLVDVDFRLLLYQAHDRYHLVWEVEIWMEISIR